MRPRFSNMFLCMGTRAAPFACGTATLMPLPSDLRGVLGQATRSLLLSERKAEELLPSLCPETAPAALRHRAQCVEGGWRRQHAESSAPSDREPWRHKVPRISLVCRPSRLLHPRAHLPRLVPALSRFPIVPRHALVLLILISS